MDQGTICHTWQNSFLSFLSWFFGRCFGFAKDVGIPPETVLVPAFTPPSHLIHSHDFRGHLDTGKFNLGHLA